MKKRSYESFWAQLHSRARLSGTPLRAMFELTYRCNFRCRHCYIPPAYKRKYALRELSTKEVFAVLDQLKGAGCLFLGFTGGEPLLRRDFPDICGYARRAGFEVIIYTNGSLIDEEKAGQLRRIGPNKVDITLPAVSPAVFDAVCGIKGGCGRVLRAVDHLRSRGVPVGLKTCVLKANAGEMDKIRAFAVSRGLSLRVDPVLLRRWDGSDKPQRYRQMSLPGDVQAGSCGSGERAAGRNKEELFACGAGLSQCAITPAGELKMCVMIDHPGSGILESSFSSCWGKMRDETRRLNQRKGYICSVCPRRPDCAWCPARGWLKSGDFSAPDCSGILVGDDEKR